MYLQHPFQEKNNGLFLQRKKIGIVHLSLLFTLSAIMCSLWLYWKPQSASGYASAINKNQDPNPHPDPHQSDKLDPDLHQFADDKPKCMEYEPI
jgi:hypothetical protein